MLPGTMLFSVVHAVIALCLNPVTDLFCAPDQHIYQTLSLAGSIGAIMVMFCLSTYLEIW